MELNMPELSARKQIDCPLCGPNNDYTVRYPEKLNLATLNFMARKTPDHTHFRIVQCARCGLVYSNPILADREILRLYRESEFISEPQVENMGEDYIEQLTRIGPLMKKDSILEIGCANGFFLKRAKEFGFHNVQGIEPGNVAVSKATPDIHKNIINDFLHPGLFPEEKFDVICFFQVFDHILDPNEFLRTLYAYLKRGGILLALHHDIKSLLPFVFGEKASTYDVEHIYYWDKKTMRLILEKNRFEIVKIENISNTYQFDHVIRMLPLGDSWKRVIRRILGLFNLADARIRIKCENMVCVARK